MDAGVHVLRQLRHPVIHHVLSAVTVLFARDHLLNYVDLTVLDILIVGVITQPIVVLRFTQLEHILLQLLTLLDVAGPVTKLYVFTLLLHVIYPVAVIISVLDVLHACTPLLDVHLIHGHIIIRIIAIAMYIVLERTIVP